MVMVSLSWKTEKRKVSALKNTLNDVLSIPDKEVGKIGDILDLDNHRFVFCKNCGGIIERKKGEKKRIVFCGDKCRTVAKKTVKDRYRKTEKGRQAYLRWCKNPKKKEIDKRSMQKPLSKIKASIRSVRNLKNNPSLLAKKKIRDFEFSKTIKGKEINHRAQKKYRQTPKGKGSIKQYKYLLRNNLSGRIDWAAWNNKLEQLKFTCQHCGGREEITIDHVIPLSKGGSNEIKNLQPLCRSCNCRKGARI